MIDLLTPEVAEVLAGTRKWAVQAADCIAFADSLPNDVIDLCLFSPPYESARLYLEGGKNLGIARNTEVWVAWMVDVFRAYSRVCKGLICCVCEGQTKNYRWSAGPVLLMADLHRAGFNLRKPPAFHRVGIPGSGGPDWLRNDYEFCVCVSRQGRLPWSENCAAGKPPKWGPGGDVSYRSANGDRKNAVSATEYGKIQTRRKADGVRLRDGVYKPPELANPGNVLHFKVGGGLMGHKLAHENEAPYPLGLCEVFVRSFCPPDGIVCDPFTGSGSTGHAAILWGRRFIGADVRESQCLLTRRRMQEIEPWKKDESLPGEPLPLFGSGF